MAQQDQRQCDRRRQAGPHRPRRRHREGRARAGEVHRATAPDEHPYGRGDRYPCARPAVPPAATGGILGRPGRGSRCTPAAPRSTASTARRARRRGKGTDRGTRAGAVLAAVLGASLAGCSSTGGKRAEDARKAQAAAGQGRGRPPRAGPSRWSPTPATATPSGTSSRSGAEQAAAKDNINFVYSHNDEGQQQAQLVQAAIDKKVDGLIVSPRQARRDEGRRRQGREGRHPGDHRQLRLRAVQGVRRAHPHRPGRGDRRRGRRRRADKRGSKKALCVLHEQGNVGHEQRCAGAKKTFDGKMQNLYVDGTNMPAVQASIEAKLQADPSIDAVVTLGAPFARRRRQGEGRPRAARPRSTPSTSTPRSPPALKDGTLGFAVDQQPYLQGYEAVDLLWLYKLQRRRARRRPARPHRPADHHQERRRRAGRSTRSGGPDERDRTTCRTGGTARPTSGCCAPRRCAGCWAAPSWARSSAPSAVFLFFSIVADSFLRASSLSHRAVRGLDHRHHGGAGGAADDRRRVRPVGRCPGDQLRADLLDVQLPDDGERLGRRPRLAAGHARRRRLQRLHADPYETAQLHHHARHVPDADRPQPRLHQADQRHGLHQVHRRHGGLRLGQEALRLPARPSATSRSRSPSCGGSAWSPLATWILLRTRFGNWIFAVGGGADAARAVGVPVDRTKIGLYMGVAFAAWVSGQHLLFSFDVVQSGEGVGNELTVHHRGRHRRLSDHRRLRLRDRLGGRRVHLRHDQQGHRVRGVEPGLVQVLPRSDAPSGHPAQRMGPQACGGDSDTTGSGTALVELDDVSKYYGNIRALEGVSLEVHAGRDHLRARRQRRRQVHPDQDHRGAAPARRGHLPHRGRGDRASPARARPWTAASPPSTRTSPSSR